MRYPFHTLVLLTIATLILPAGCPQATTGSALDDLIGGSGSSGSSSTRSTPASDTDSTISTGSPAVGGDSAGVDTFPDALSVEFPLCEEPVEGVFWRTEVLTLVNRERAARGLDALTQNSTLEDQATQYACEMIQGDFFGHQNPLSGSSLPDRTLEFGYDYWMVGENLAAGQITPAEVVDDWMNSPCHRENLLNPNFTEIGIGIRYGGDYGYYWVQEFGRPRAITPPPFPEYEDPECDHSS
jgi:uncharacterized protein YkwD